MLFAVRREEHIIHKRQRRLRQNQFEGSPLSRVRVQRRLTPAMPSPLPLFQPLPPPRHGVVPIQTRPLFTVVPPSSIFTHMPSPRTRKATSTQAYRIQFVCCVTIVMYPCCEETPAGKVEGEKNMW